MPTIMFFHGFQSSSQSSKATSLKERLGDTNVIAPDMSPNPLKVLAQVDQLVAEVTEFPLVFVGISLGGFWANYFAHKYDALCVIINPAITPSKLMKPRVGQTFHNHHTGEIIDEITHSDVGVYKYLEDELAELYNGALVHLFLAADDDHLDHREAIDTLRFFQNCRITQDGGHRFKKHWPEVIDFISDLSSKLDK